MLNQKSIDWLLVASLHRLYALRAVRAAHIIESVEKWRHRLSALCIALALSWLALHGDGSANGALALCAAAVVLPQVFGFWIAEQVRHLNAAPGNEVIGVIAFDIIRGIESEALFNLEYIRVFTQLLEAVVDGNLGAALAAANELDAYGNYCLSLTNLVRVECAAAA